MYFKSVLCEFLQKLIYLVTRYQIKNKCKIFIAIILCSDVRNAYKILVGKPEGRRQLERNKLRWERGGLL